MTVLTELTCSSMCGAFFIIIVDQVPISHMLTPGSSGFRAIYRDLRKVLAKVRLTKETAIKLVSQPGIAKKCYFIVLMERL